MENRQATKIIFFIILLGVINFFANMAISHAEQVYNFYFNPEGPGANNPATGQAQPGQIAAQPAAQPDAPPIKPREIAPASSYLPKEKVEWSDDYSLFRLGLYYFGGIPDVERDYKGAIKKQVKGSSGGTLALQVFPIKYWGLFGEAIVNKDFKKYYYAVGTEIVPIHINVFGYEDLLALGGEIGWGSYSADVGYGLSPLKDTATEWFGGFKTHIKLSRELYADAGFRKSFDAPIWTANAGISLHF